MEVEIFLRFNILLWEDDKEEMWVDDDKEEWNREVSYFYGVLFFYV